MQILKKTNAPRYIRDEGITSYLLSSPTTCDAVQMATTLVEILPGGKQKVHQHKPEQIYFILEGAGKMTVGNKSQLVEKDDCIFIPANEPHGLENIGQVTVKYFSAAAPSFTQEQLTEYWPLKGETESTKG